jgi:hypothetical protein
MTIQATVILDSGCFLPVPENNNGAYTEIGYFGSSKSVSDIRVLADGIERTDSEPINLEKNSTITVRHVKANGKVRKDRVKGSPSFHSQLLHTEDLYGKGKHQAMDRAKFDCIIRFESGYFCGSLVKPRYFEEIKKQADGKFAHTEGCGRKLVKKPIAHNILVHFKLNNGETLELERDGKVIWSSKDSGVKDWLELEIIADNTTAEKFYRLALKDEKDSYWLPNNGDPPPMCSQPPCEP